MANGSEDSILSNETARAAKLHSLRRGLLSGLALVLLLSACGKKPRPEPSQMPPPTETSGGRESGDAAGAVRPTAPILDIRIEPPVVSPGESALLTWESTNADEVVIEPAIGVVDRSGRIKFFPEASTTYSVTARGPGGEVTRSVTVDVRGPAGAAGGRIGEEDLAVPADPARFGEALKPVFFSFDSAELTPEAREILSQDAAWLSQPETSGLEFVLEGHADERGSEEYNLALADKRAAVVRDYLVGLGIQPSRMQTVSLGEERPFDTRQSEEGWALNRRVQFVLLQRP